MSLMRDLFAGKKRNERPGSSTVDLNHLLNGYRHTALIYVAAKLKLPDLLAENSRTSAELASILNVHASSLQRVLRGLVVLGLFTEDEQGRFGITATGARLKSKSGGSEYSLAILNGEEYATAWNHLLHSVKTGETAFDHAFGQTPWEHRRATPG